MSRARSRPLRFAIAGTGRIAADYLTALDRVSELELTGVADLRLDVARTVGERWACPAFADPSAMIEATGAEAVLVCVPPAAHESVSLACLERGAHVLCEKPFALHTAGALRLLEHAKQAGRVLTMSAKFRHVRDVIEAKARIDSGILGTLAFADNAFASEVDMASRWNADPEISGGGVLIDNGTHSVDLLRYLFGPVRWVRAFEGPRLQALAVEDTARLMLGFSSGMLASADLSWSISTRSPWYVSVHGDAGTLRLGWRESIVERRGREVAERFGSGYSKVDALAAQLRHFARLVRGDEPPLLDDAGIVASVQVVEAAYQSLERGGEHVAVTAPDG